jgi:c(7)-type cytochrome triheme protein
MMMQRCLGMVFSLALCCMMIGLAWKGALAQQQPKLPADLAFPLEKGSPGKVTFSHEKHAEKNPKCTDCHTKIFKMKQGTSGTPTMAAMNEGKFCGACHDGQKAFSTKAEATCSKCHGKE